jgi:hypothetical protein
MDGAAASLPQELCQPAASAGKSGNSLISCERHAKGFPDRACRRRRRIAERQFLPKLKASELENAT